MTVPRLIGLLVLFGSLGIVVVTMRADQVRRSNRIQQMQFEQLGRRQKIWANEMEIARLRSPQMVRERTRRLAMPLAPPYQDANILPADEAGLADQ